MDSWEEKAKELYNKLNKESEKPHSNRDFSVEAVKEFCWWFELVILGTMQYLKDGTASFDKSECIIKSSQTNEIKFNSQKDFDDFQKQMIQIYPPVEINFEITYMEGTYITENISDDISVYFKMNEYSIIYRNSIEGQVKGYNKAYNERLTTEEIKEIRDEMKEYVFKKVAEILDK